MKKIKEGIWTWSVFSDEKKLDFNGLYMNLGRKSVLIDPPHLSDEDWKILKGFQEPSVIILTNKDHRRASAEIRKALRVPIAIHELDKPHLDFEPDRVFEDRDVLAGELCVIHLPDMKSPGESALYWPDEKVLVLGDALIGKPPGSLSLLPSEKFKNVNDAARSIERLLPLQFDMLLVGDGESIPKDGHLAVTNFLKNKVTA